MVIPHVVTVPLSGLGTLGTSPRRIEGAHYTFVLGSEPERRPSELSEADLGAEFCECLGLVGGREKLWAGGASLQDTDERPVNGRRRSKCDSFRSSFLCRISFCLSLPQGLRQRPVELSFLRVT